MCVASDRSTRTFGHMQGLRQISSRREVLCLGKEYRLRDPHELFICVRVVFPGFLIVCKAGRHVFSYGRVAPYRLHLPVRHLNFAQGSNGKTSNGPTNASTTISRSRVRLSRRFVPLYDSLRVRLYVPRPMRVVLRESHSNGYNARVTQIMQGDTYPVNDGLRRRVLASFDRGLVEVNFPRSPRDQVSPVGAFSRNLSATWVRD